MMLSGAVFDSRIKSCTVTVKEKLLGYFIGSVSVSLMVSILNNYLNVYYTDVLHMGNLWDGAFLSMFPVICRVLGAVTFIFMGRIIDKTDSPQGKARPWILISAPVLLSSMVLLFFVPQGGEWAQAAWIFISYNLFYSIGYTAYAAAHTLLVPLFCALLLYMEYLLYGGMGNDGKTQALFFGIGNAALGIFNFFLVRLQYQAPVENGFALAQNAEIRNFFSFGALGAPMACYVILAVLLHISEKRRVP